MFVYFITVWVIFLPQGTQTGESADRDDRSPIPHSSGEVRRLEALFSGQPKQLADRQTELEAIITDMLHGRNVDGSRWILCGINHGMSIADKDILFTAEARRSLVAYCHRDFSRSVSEIQFEMLCVLGYLARSDTAVLRVLREFAETVKHRSGPYISNCMVTALAAAGDEESIRKVNDLVSGKRGAVPQMVTLHVLYSLAVHDDYDIRQLVLESTVTSKLIRALAYRVVSNGGEFSEDDAAQLATILSAPAEIGYVAPFYFSDRPTSSTGIVLSLLTSGAITVEPHNHKSWVLAIENARMHNSKVFDHIVHQQLQKAASRLQMSAP